MPPTRAADWLRVALPDPVPGDLFEFCDQWNGAEREPPLRPRGAARYAGESHQIRVPDGNINAPLSRPLPWKELRLLTSEA